MITVLWSRSIVSLLIDHISLQGRGTRCDTTPGNTIYVEFLCDSQCGEADVTFWYRLVLSPLPSGVFTYTHTYAHTDACMHAHTHTRTCTHTHTHRLVLSPLPSGVFTHTHMHACTYTHTCTHAHKHAHILRVEPFLHQNKCKTQEMVHELNNL